MWRYLYSPFVFGTTFFLGMFFSLWFLMQDKSKKEKISFFLLFLVSHYSIIFLTTYIDGLLLNYYDWWKDWFYIKYVIIYAVDMVIMKYYGKINWPTSIFIVNIGHCFQHSCQYFYQIVTTLMNISMFSLSGALIRLFFTMVYTTFFYFVTKSRLENIDSTKIKQNSFMVFSTLIIVFFTIIGNSYFWNIATKSNNAIPFELSILIFTGLIAVLLIAWQLSILKNEEIAADLDVVKKMLHEQKSYYEREKAVIDTLNIKSHDLKHRIGELRTRMSKEDYDEMEKIILDYDTFIETGNKAVDIILTEKDILCRKKNIRFTAFIEGKKLNFIQENDIYALLGNILDNAIEAVEKMDEDEKKVITISTVVKSGFIMIHEENIFDGKLIIENDELKTTKKNTLYHGFGVKSIRMISEKYHGDVTFKTKDKTFILDIMFPLHG